MQSFKTMVWAYLTGNFQNPDGEQPTPSMEFDTVSGPEQREDTER